MATPFLCPLKAICGLKGKHLMTTRGYWCSPPPHFPPVGSSEYLGISMIEQAISLGSSSAKWAGIGLRRGPDEWGGGMRHGESDRERVSTLIFLYFILGFWKNDKKSKLPAAWRWRWRLASEENRAACEESLTASANRTFWMLGELELVNDQKPLKSF
jgi:hypothetical protein